MREGTPIPRGEDEVAGYDSASRTHHSLHSPHGPGRTTDLSRQTNTEPCLAAREARNDTTSYPIIFVLNGRKESGNGRRRLPNSGCETSRAMTCGAGHSYLASAGISRLTISKVLNHVETQSDRGV
jgi:hypothetical protein